MTRKLIYVAILIVIVAVNPLFCIAIPQFHFGEGDMRRAVEGTWVVTPQQGAPIRFTAIERGMHAAREGLFHTAGACGSRSFVYTAGACDVDSRLDLAITSTDIAADTGTFRVYGAEFERGELEIWSGTKLGLSAQIAADGHVIRVDLVVGGHNVPATLARM